MKNTQIRPGIYLYENVFQDPETLLKHLKEESHYGTFTINDKLLCRTGSFEGDQLEDGVVPWLRCPSIEHQMIRPWSRGVLSMKHYIELVFGHKTNIAKIQCYPNGDSFINAHSDKILDLDPKTPIIVARLGASRTCEIIHKKSNESIRFQVPNNSLLFIDYDANLEWTHGIRSEPEVTEESYSVVFRKAVTFLHSSGYLFGRNTPFKTIADIKRYKRDHSQFDVWDAKTQREELVHCYRREKKEKSSMDIYKDVIKHAIFPF
jgi:hypothetical protein